jgi:hypothetical protein
VQFLPEPVLVTAEIRAMRPPVQADGRVVPLTEFLRFSGPCIRSACVHFEDETCRLADTVVEAVEEVATEPPECPIRSQCRWFAQVGQGACSRCPGIVTDSAREGSSALGRYLVSAGSVQHARTGTVD